VLVLALTDPTLMFGFRRLALAFSKRKSYSMPAIFPTFYMCADKHVGSQKGSTA
jgi:hypothetical protein